MTGQDNEIQWYIARDGKQHGPLTDVEMRTFVAHNYLRVSDLIWRPGMPEWLAAPVVFPAAFQGQAQQQPAPAAARPAVAPAAAPAYQQRPAPQQQQYDAHRADYGTSADGRSSGGRFKKLALATIAITLIGGGALALTMYRQPLIEMVAGSSGSSDATADAPPTVSAPSDTAQLQTPDSQPSAQSADASSSMSRTSPGAGDVIPDSQPSSQEPPAADATQSQPAASPPDSQPTTTSSVSVGTPDAPQNSQTQVAAVEPQSSSPPSPASIDGSITDSRLQKVPVWALIKREYPDWYVTQVSAANKLVADRKSDNEVAMLLAQGLVSLRRQNADKALAASSDKLQKIAVAFLDHLKALRTESVSACFGFISKGETSPAVVQMMENPESATALNAQAGAIFDAISEGTRNPVKHDAAVKSDYDMLIKELSKLGWKEEDLQVFSNPKLLAKREPEQVCKMVQEWFVAHLAVPDKSVRDRLLYETLKPVVSG